MKTKNRIMWVLVASLSLVLPQVSFAQGVGNLGSLPTNFAQVGGGWNVGTPLTPIPVVRDPNGPKWVKHFFDPNGLLPVFPGQTFGVHESLIIAPNLPWSDWHEEILTKDWSWSPTIQISVNGGGPPTNLNIVNIPGSPLQGGILNFYFDSLPVGTQIDIRKQLVYTGTSAGIAIPSIEVAQYPTPEPTTLGLLAIGSLAALRRRRRFA